MKKRKAVRKLTEACERVIRQFIDYVPAAGTMVSVRKARKLLAKIGEAK